MWFTYFTKIFDGKQNLDSAQSMAGLVLSTLVKMTTESKISRCIITAMPHKFERNIYNTSVRPELYIIFFNYDYIIPIKYITLHRNNFHWGLGFG